MPEKRIDWPPATPEMMLVSAAMVGKAPPINPDMDMDALLKDQKTCELCQRELPADYPMSAENPGVCKDCPVLLQRNREDPVQPASTDKCRDCLGPLDVGWIREVTGRYVSIPLFRSRYPPCALVICNVSWVLMDRRASAAGLFTAIAANLSTYITSRSSRTGAAPHAITVPDYAATGRWTVR